jgi:hypothetical protein
LALKKQKINKIQKRCQKRLTKSFPSAILTGQAEKV